MRVRSRYWQIIAASDHTDWILLVGNLRAFYIALLARSPVLRGVIDDDMDANVGCSGHEEARKAFCHRRSLQQPDNGWLATVTVPSLPLEPFNREICEYDVCLQTLGCILTSLSCPATKDSARSEHEIS